MNDELQIQVFLYLTTPFAIFIIILYKPYISDFCFQFTSAFERDAAVMWFKLKIQKSIISADLSNDVDVLSFN